jgi:hypothetical protein
MLQNEAIIMLSVVNRLPGGLSPHFTPFVVVYYIAKDQPARKLRTLGVEKRENTLHPNL